MYRVRRARAGLREGFEERRQQAGGYQSARIKRSLQNTLTFQQPVPTTEEVDVLFHPPHNLYQRLELAEDASVEEIREAFRRLVKELHPTTNFTSAEDERFLGVVVAYEVLSDPNRRNAYGELLAEYREKPGATASLERISNLYKFLGEELDGAWWFWPSDEYEGVVRQATKQAGYELDDFPFDDDGWVKRHRYALYERELASLRREHESELASLRREHESELASLRREHESGLASLRREHESDQGSLRRAYESDRGAVERDRDLVAGEKRSRLNELRRQFEQDRDRRQQKYDTDAATRQERYRADVSERKEQYATDVARAEKQFDRAVEELRIRYGIVTPARSSVSSVGRLPRYAIAGACFIALVVILVLLLA
jgi:curved DNA-binding protein CbpA